MSSSDLATRTVYETDNFMAVIAPLSLTAEWKGTVGYRIFNKRTGVCEQETNLEAMAIRICHRNEDMLKDVLGDPAGNKAQQRFTPPETDEDDLSDLIPRGGYN